MSQAEIDKRNCLINYATKYGSMVFVETGTYKGDTVKAMLVSGLFERIYTVDIYKDRVDRAIGRFASHSHVHCLHGDSGTIIKDILKETNKPTLFWLDAHHSGKQIARQKGLISTPIVAELEAVLSRDNGDNDVVLIDDARYYEEFSVNYDNYPSTQCLQDLVAKYRPDWTFENKEDIIRCHR